MLKHVLALAFLLGGGSIQTDAHAEEMPFGLDWGKTVTEVEAMGITCSKKTTDERFTLCTTDELPENPYERENYLLVFHNKPNKKSLHTVVLFPGTITDDPDGSKGKKDYATMKSKLEKKFGDTWSSSEYSGEHPLWSERDEFYQCIQNFGCGEYNSIFRSEAGDWIRLELVGTGSGEGYIMITYEPPNN